MINFRLVSISAIFWAVGCVIGTQSMADKLSLDQISDYLDTLITAQTVFQQINSDGSVSTGTIYIKRPGRMRFEYDPPLSALVLASGGAIAIFDPKSDQGPETYPLNKTPLAIFLNKDVDLKAEKMLIDHSYDGIATSIIAQDPNHPEYGSIQLFFTDNPTQLRQWVVYDDAGGQTMIVLDQFRTGMPLENTFFNIQLQTQRETGR